MVHKAHNTKRASFDQVAKLVADADRILVSAHKNPDGDAIGCILAMSRILMTLGKQYTAFCPDGVPPKLAFLSCADKVTNRLDTTPYDVTLLFDTSSENLLPAGFPSPNRRGVLIVIDHHSQCDDMGDVVVRHPASAVGELLFEMASHVGWPIDNKTAESLYTTIVSDTSSFRYESATPKCHEAAAKLISLGARPGHVAIQLFESVPLQRQRLLAKVLQTLTISADGQYAQMMCTLMMLKEANATKEDLDGMINYARAIEGVALAALIREESNGDIKLSLRSKGAVDASQFAGRFGGGGHKNAGGAYFSDKTIKEVASEVAQKAMEIFEQQGSKTAPSGIRFAEPSNKNNLVKTLKEETKPPL